MIIDDYAALPACKLAVSEYRKEHAITEAELGGRSLHTADPNVGNFRNKGHFDRQPNAAAQSKRPPAPLFKRSNDSAPDR